MCHSDESDVGSGGELGSQRSGPLDGEIFQKRGRDPSLAFLGGTAVCLLTISCKAAVCASLDQTAMEGRITIVIDGDYHTGSALLLFSELLLGRVDFLQPSLDLVEASFGLLGILLAGFKSPVDGIKLRTELISFGQEVLVEIDRHRLEPIIFLKNGPVVGIQAGLSP